MFFPGLKLSTLLQPVAGLAQDYGFFKPAHGDIAKTDSTFSNLRKVISFCHREGQFPGWIRSLFLGRAGIRDRAQQGIFRLPRVQTGVLDDNGYIGLDHTCEIRVRRDRFRIGQIVKPNVLGPARGNRESIRAARIAIRIVNCDFDTGIRIPCVQNTNRLVTRELGLRTVAVGRDVSFRDRPSFCADWMHFFMLLALERSYRAGELLQLWRELALIKAEKSLLIWTHLMDVNVIEAGIGKGLNLCQISLGIGPAHDA
jgi:hypothetical protein